MRKNILCILCNAYDVYHNILRIVPQQNTALLSYVCVSVCVRHRCDISAFLHCARFWTIQTIYFLKGNDTRTSKTMFPCVWCANTQIQIHKYTNVQIHKYTSKQIQLWSVIVKAYLLTLNFYNKHNRDPNELDQWSNMLYNFQLEHMQCWWKTFSI